MAFFGVSFFAWRSQIYCIFWESLFCNELKALFFHWVKENVTILIYSEVFHVIFRFSWDQHFTIEKKDLGYVLHDEIREVVFQRPRKSLTEKYLQRWQRFVQNGSGHCSGSARVSGGMAKHCLGIPCYSKPLRSQK